MTEKDKKKLSIIKSISSTIATMNTFLEIEGVSDGEAGEIAKSKDRLNRYLEKIIRSDEIPEEVDYVKKIIDNFVKAFDQN